MKIPVIIVSVLVMLALVFLLAQPPRDSVRRIAQLATPIGTSVAQTPAVTPINTRVDSITPKAPTPVVTRTSLPPITPVPSCGSVPTVIPNITMNWPVYENRDLKFRIKYPPNYVFRASEGLPYQDRLFQMAFFDSQYLSRIGVSTEPFPTIGLTVHENPDRLTVDEYLYAHLDNGTHIPPQASTVIFTNIENICARQISGVRALAFIDHPWAPHTPKGGQYTLLVSRENRVFRIIYLPDFVLDNPELQTTFTSMTSTFELIP